MTDAEVMKNTRCCADNYCKNCSLQGKPNCKNMLLSFAWNTMYNQKEENDRQKAEIERLNGLITEWKAEAYKLSDSMMLAKAEAVKEVIEKLKDKLQHRALFSVIDTIDEVEKEYVKRFQL